jgi:hypothetical protein
MVASNWFTMATALLEDQFEASAGEPPSSMV